MENEQTGMQTYTAPEHYFGCCPECRLQGRLEMGGEFITLKSTQYVVCRLHGVAWPIGWILTPEDGYEERAPQYRALLQSYRLIEHHDCPHLNVVMVPAAPDRGDLTLPNPMEAEPPF